MFSSALNIYRYNNHHCLVTEVLPRLISYGVQLLLVVPWLGFSFHCGKFVKTTMTADNVLPCCNAQIIATVRQNSYRHLTFVRTGQTDLLVSSINLFHSKFLLTTFVKMMSPFSIGGISSLFPSGRAPS